MVHPHRLASISHERSRGETLDIPSNLEFVGFDEEEFRVAYDAFQKTPAELGGLKESPPPLNSKFWRERGV